MSKIDLSENEQSWYFTFGYGQNHGPRGYAVFWGTYSSARAEMVRRYGSKWAFQYPSAETAGVEKYNLKEIKR